MLLISTELAPSRIHGLGVFTRQFVKAGTPIWRFQPGFDAEFDPASLGMLPDVTRDFLRHYAYLDSRSGKYVLNGDHGRFMNHSDSPNTGAGVAGPNTEVITVALTDLPVGIELTCDYRAFDGDVRWKLGR